MSAAHAAVDLDPKYTAICSERTVQSTDRGFFQELFNGVRQACPPRWLHDTFAGQSDNTGRMRCLLQSSGPGAHLLAMLENVQPVFKPKDARFSVQRRREGDRLADDGEWERALVLLSQAVVRAPPKGGCVCGVWSEQLCERLLYEHTSPSILRLSTIFSCGPAIGGRTASGTGAVVAIGSVAGAEQRTGGAGRFAVLAGVWFAGEATRRVLFAAGQGECE